MYTIGKIAGTDNIAIGNSSLSYYRYVKFLATQNMLGITSIYADLSQHFQSMGKRAKKAPDTPEAPQAPQGE